MPTPSQRERDAAPLWRAYRRGRGTDARNALVTHFHYLAEYEAGAAALRLPPRRRAEAYGDLLSDASLALIAAVEEYAPAYSKLCFAPFARQRIRWRLIDGRRPGWFDRRYRRVSLDGAAGPCAPEPPPPSEFEGLCSELLRGIHGPHQREAFRRVHVLRRPESAVRGHMKGRSRRAGRDIYFDALVQIGSSERLRDLVRAHAR